MIPPKNVHVIESSLSYMWFEEDGIFCSVFKQGAELTKKSLEDSFKEIMKLSGGKKICWLGEVTHVTSADRETRDYASEVSPDIIQALAILTHSPISNMMANLYLGLKKPAFPARLFSDEHKAREWLRKYL